MTKNQKIAIWVGAIAVITLVACGVWIASASKTPNKTANKTVNADVESTTTLGDRKTIVNQNPPAEAELAKAEQAIRTFMGEPNLDLAYKGQKNHPDNFAVLSNVKQNEGGFAADNPEEWDRSVYIFEQKDYINDRCEVYRYQVTQKTNQVVEIGIVYPEEIQQGNPAEQQERKKQCSKYGSLEIPLKTKAEIEQMAFAYLGRDPEHTKFTLRSDIQPEYIPSKPGAANPAMNEWKWEDKSYKLPEGLMGDPSSYPTMRIIISSGGKLVYYLNTTELFEKN